MFSGFQSNAVQRNAFQIVGTPATPNSGLLGGTAFGEADPGIVISNLNIEAMDAEWARRKEEKKRAEERVIELKLQAQQIILDKKNLEGLREKQAIRQIRAMEKEEAELNKRITQQMQLIERLTLMHNNNQAIIALMLADPFFTYGGSMN